MKTKYKWAASEIVYRGSYEDPDFSILGIFNTEDEAKKFIKTIEHKNSCLYVKKVRHYE